jgi:ATP-dependent DNA ligase
MKFEKLYAKSSNGKIKTWEIEARGNTMVIRNGYLDGKIAEQTKEIEGKNLGRSNETSAEEQCVLECKSKWQKKIDEQYTTDQNDIKDYTDQEVLLPMLALNYRDRAHDIKFPCYIQPKLNGVRCIYQNGKFMSRKGKEYTTLSHLVPELKKLGIIIPDGEIYAPELTFQEIIRLVKKDRGEDNSTLQYWIYDQVNQDTFEERTRNIQGHFGTQNFIKLVRVETILVNSEEEIKKYHDKWVREGFEGAIIRNSDGRYKVKHRSKDLQKYKEFFDAEFEIVGGHEGSGPDAGTVVFEVKTKDGKVFSVRPKGTRELRTQYLMELCNLIGKELTVRYQNLSEDGIPIFPVGLAIRDYE